MPPHPDRATAPLAALFLLAGLLHLLRPAGFDAIVPAPIPARAATHLSGAAQLAGGVGLLYVPTRSATRRCRGGRCWRVCRCSFRCCGGRGVPGGGRVVAWHMPGGGRR